MPERILTEVTATVAVDREADLIDGFRRLLSGPFPEGLLRTELLRGTDHQWRIQTLWRDRAALDLMRRAADPPAAPALFRLVGADPSLQVLELELAYP